MFGTAVALLLLCFSSFPAHASPSPAPVPRTGQTDCYQGALAVSCAGTGQDGDALSGAAWPAPRFSDTGNQSITDHLTLLTWAKDANAARGYKTWQEALDFIGTLNAQRYLGQSDWRLPNVRELESLMIKNANLVAWLSSQGFDDVRGDYYWTSSTYANYPAYAWCLGTYSGIVAPRRKTEGAFVWPVRGGLGVPVLPRTGQTACFNTAGIAIDCAGTLQDAEFRAGVPWQTPRFVDNGDGTISDRLSGLVWTKSARAPGPAECRPGAQKDWQEALGYAKCLNEHHFMGKEDWRLPNRNELMSLMNYGQANSSKWLGSQGFSETQASSYWSSSTYSCATQNAWSGNMHDGAVSSTPKKYAIDVWPVRSPQTETAR